ncbi:upstream activation factor subunit spp27 [Ceratitis capitata]|uniref:(Mediterranean fruit fly) hypothetical protein n=1 Tax=Ceratitis capitata TaxID=7213 RepID=W8B395_CERCA|nr:upstream activation factor subunit spp27 [Ceratitis capitata]CAD7006637.1 unnamed protein product [Ceratitis capitata]
MADISTEDLKTEINAILKTADLSVVSVKKVREQVEKKLNCSLLSRKKEFDFLVMDFINQQQEDDEQSSEEEEKASSEDEEEEEVEKKSAKKRPQPTPRKAAASKQKKKRKSINDSDSGSESDAGSDSDYEMPKKKGPKKKASGGAGGGGGGTGRKSTGFTRPYNLSPELSALLGAEALPRHEVVKKVWAIIKERNLYDPKNKQFAICDDELMKVMKVKRFRTFGMLKHLKPHFLD